MSEHCIAGSRFECIWQSLEHLAGRCPNRTGHLGAAKFDAELILDGKASNPQQMTDGAVTATNVTGATLVPAAFGLGGVSLHTWTGWGSVPHWNAFVANLEMHGVGRFWDPRLNSAAQFAIAGGSQIRRSSPHFSG